MGLKQALHEQSRAAVRGQELGDFENAPVGLLRGALDDLVDFLHRRVAAAVAAEQAIDVGPDPVEDHHADALAGPVLAEEGLERVELGILDRRVERLLDRVLGHIAGRRDSSAFLRLPVVKLFQDVLDLLRPVALAFLGVGLAEGRDGLAGALSARGAEFIGVELRDDMEQHILHLARGRLERGGAAVAAIPVRAAVRIVAAGIVGMPAVTVTAASPVVAAPHVAHDHAGDAAELGISRFRHRGDANC